MNFQLCIAICIFGIGCGGCTSSRLALPVNTPVSATGAVESHQTNTVSMRLVVAEFGRDLQHAPAIEISVTNGEAAPITFSSENVTAFSGEHPVRVYAPEDYARQTRHEWQIRVNQVQSTTASKQQALQTALFNPGMPSGIELTTDAMTQIQALRSTAQKQILAVGQLLYPTTLRPHMKGGGVVRFHGEDLDPGTPLKVTVRVGSETHVFVFDIR